MTEGRYWRHWYNTANWHAMRARQLRREPSCRLCWQRKEYTAATSVDHIKPHRGNPGLFWDSDNLQSLCTRCHSSIKQSLELRPDAGTLLNGRPASPHHWWNKKAKAK